MSITKNKSYDSTILLETNSHLLLKIAQFLRDRLGVCETLAQLCNVNKIELQYS